MSAAYQLEAHDTSALQETAALLLLFASFHHLQPTSHQDSITFLKKMRHNLFTTIARESGGRLARDSEVQYPALAINKMNTKHINFSGTDDSFASNMISCQLGTSIMTEDVGNMISFQDSQEKRRYCWDFEVVESLLRSPKLQ